MFTHMLGELAIIACVALIGAIIRMLVRRRRINRTHAEILSAAIAGEILTVHYDMCRSLAKSGFLYVMFYDPGKALEGKFYLPGNAQPVRAGSGHCMIISVPTCNLSTETRGSLFALVFANRRAAAFIDRRKVDDDGMRYLGTRLPRGAHTISALKCTAALSHSRK